MSFLSLRTFSICSLLWMYYRSNTGTITAPVPSPR
jgi:hypothetical protein